MPPGITVLGLGPGDASLLTRAAWEALGAARTLYLRTARHPTVAALPAHLELRSFDALYEQAAGFEEIYDHIAQELVARAASGEPVLYAVPGHPLVAEATTRRLLALARERGVATRIIPGLSFVEPTCELLGLDPLERGLQLLDALDLIPPFGFSVLRSQLPSHEEPQNSEPQTQAPSWASLHGRTYHPPLVPFPLVATRPALVCQVYSRAIASHVKLSLMERYPAAHPVTLVRAAGVVGAERAWSVPLHELDRQEDIDHLTSLYAPPLEPLADLRGPEGVGYVVARLLGPGGCPWDREQDHRSLRGALLEEAHEALEALDAGDEEALAEELGDLLLNILMHSEIARQSGGFTIGDVYEHVAAKLIRRHPHVFEGVGGSGQDTALSTGTAPPSPNPSAGQVLQNWEQIKRGERAARGQAPRGALEGIPVSLPALAAAQQLMARAARAGFDSPEIEHAWELLHEEARELRAAAESGDAAHLEAELGDLLLAAARLAWKLEVDAESALRAANGRFKRRFARLEEHNLGEG
ncbi:MAG TPA: nucleoside triphosphate pyrophosphohydrolase [Roseiflexaceae bacterium]|nr:nucleoside triphosphate pyrophosphohydrolase [Roseiflexaceae bacterium]